MSIKERKLNQIDRLILNLKHREAETTDRLKKAGLKIYSFLSLLYYEVVKNDVTIRAESLSYFTLFSLMPLMAGVFLLIGLFSKWAPVQNQFQELLEKALQAIPEEQRDTLLDFIVQFKDEYLAKLTQQSSVIGIFALGVLIWISAKVFFNIESLMNRIWAVRYERLFFERIRNFILCMVIFPVSFVIALSLPGIIEHFGQKELGVMLNEGVPVLIMFFSFSFIFRYFPNTKVAWKNAHWGAVAGTVGFGISQYFLRYYFHFGTSTGYGKAAVLPIFAFFIYVSWLIFIIAAEISLICQLMDIRDGEKLPQTTLGQALILEKIVILLNERFQSKLGPMSSPELSKVLNAAHVEVEEVLRFLKRKEVVVSVVNNGENGLPFFVLARAVGEADLLEIIKDYLNLGAISQRFDVYRLLNRIKAT